MGTGEYFRFPGSTSALSLISLSARCEARRHQRGGLYGRSILVSTPEDDKTDKFEMGHFRGSEKPGFPGFLTCGRCREPGEKSTNRGERPENSLIRRSKIFAVSSSRKLAAFLTDQCAPRVQRLTSPGPASEGFAGNGALTASAPSHAGTTARGGSKQG